MRIRRPGSDPTKYAGLARIEITPASDTATFVAVPILSAFVILVDEYERSGHRFVVLDVAITADGRPVQRVRHTAIYEPRRGPKPA